MTTPRPEYPRPQLAREAWLNLNGPWAFAFDPGLSGVERGLPAGEGFDREQTASVREIVVPFCPESALSGIADVDSHFGVWYQRTVRVPDDWSGQRVLLHVGACDHDARVWVNGRAAGWHSGGFTPFTLDVTPHLARGENAIVIEARDDTRSPLQAGGKQCPDYHSRRCHYTHTTGIWQTVWLEPVPDTYLGRARLTPDLAGGALRIDATVAGTLARGTFRARASLKGSPMGEVEARFDGDRVAAVLPLNEAVAWAPGDPTLYDLELELVTERGSRDVVSSYFGLRSLALTDRAILLNGRPVYQRLVLDQGFYPDGVYTAPDDEALRNDIAISQGLGFNGARLHQKVFEPRFLYWADRMGYLVWGEFPNWGLDVHDPRALGVFVPQWLEAVERDYSHPFLVRWCPFSET